MEKNIEIQKKIKEERIKQGISIRKLAQMAKCSDRSIVYWESGKREISVNMADKLLKTLGIQIQIGVSSRIK